MMIIYNYIDNNLNIYYLFIYFLEFIELDLFDFNDDEVDFIEYHILDEYPVYLIISLLLFLLLIHLYTNPFVCSPI